MFLFCLVFFRLRKSSLSLKTVKRQLRRNNWTKSPKAAKRKMRMNNWTNGRMEVIVSVIWKYCYRKGFSPVFLYNISASNPINTQFQQLPPEIRLNQMDFLILMMLRYEYCISHLFLCFIIRIFWSHGRCTYFTKAYQMRSEYQTNIFLLCSFSSCHMRNLLVDIHSG